MEQPTEPTSEAATSVNEVTKEPAGPASLLAKFALRWEIVAVLFIGVFPTLSWNLLTYYAPQASNWWEQFPYAIYALYSCSLSACIIVPVLYLIWRSGEPWAGFGFVRARRVDLPIAISVSVLVVLFDKLLPLASLQSPSLPSPSAY